MPVRLIMCNARSGDAFVVQAGPPGNVWTAVIDAGPPGTAGSALRPVLEFLEVSEVNLLAVTHVDNDHIGGAIELVRAQLNGSLASPIREAWHNSFQQLTQDHKVTTSALIRHDMETIAGTNTQLTDRDGVMALVASIDQGHDLADLLAQADLGGNPPFSGLITADHVAHWNGNPTITVLGPSDEQIEKLRREWRRGVNQELAAHKAALFATASLDQSVTNLASIVFLFEADGRRILFTGDARGDHIVDAVDNAGLLTSGHMHVDVLKVPHHGSRRSCTQALFETVTADHYVVSGDGTHDNPHIETARRLGRALGGRHATVWLSHDVSPAADEFQKHADVVVRNSSDVGVQIEL